MPEPTTRTAKDVSRETAERIIAGWEHHGEWIDIPKSELLETFTYALLQREREVREEDARIAEADGGKPECPFGHPKVGDLVRDLTEDDPCPVCKQTGHDDGSLCHDLARNRIAAAIRSRLPAQEQGSGK